MKVPVLPVHSRHRQWENPSVRDTQSIGHSKSVSGYSTRARSVAVPRAEKRGHFRKNVQCSVEKS